MRHGIAAVLSSVFWATFLLAGCGDEEATKEIVPFVKTVAVGQVTATTENVYEGFVCGRYETNMAFQVGGKILRRNVEVGSVVNAGDVLMTIDPKDIRQQSNQNEAQVAAALANLKLAESNLARYRELYNQQAIAAATLDQYENSYEAALSDYQNATAARAISSNALTYTNLTADADGVVSRINVEEGQVVAAGQEVLTLVQTGELETEINLPENRIADATVGKAVKVKFWALPKEIDGVIREIYPMADATSKTYKARISMPNVPPEVRLGMTAAVTVVADAKDNAAVELPLSALYQTGEDTLVWIVNAENIVKPKKVTVREFRDNAVTVEGLNTGEVVVTAGVHKLRENQQVQTKGDEK